MTNAFTTTGPSTIKLRQKSKKQMTKDATRKNVEAPLCAFIPPEKAQKIRKAAI
jgi:hypothetical protein